MHCGPRLQGPLSDSVSMVGGFITRHTCSHSGSWMLFVHTSCNNLFWFSFKRSMPACSMPCFTESDIASINCEQRDTIKYKHQTYNLSESFKLQPSYTDFIICSLLVFKYKKSLKETASIRVIYFVCFAKNSIFMCIMSYRDTNSRYVP